MSWLEMVFVGGGMGLVGYYLHPKQVGLRCLPCCAVGMVGNFLMGLIGQLLGIYREGSMRGMFAVLAGTALILWMYTWCRTR
ncbi:MAG: hypothetical protein IT497_08255 [Ottowia sp.]|nr:hypothetical protein [Ottowia sp.]